eukprot:scaffold1239_cov175-Pinguiococcus_pyrenoidosus.AAC.29
MRPKVGLPGALENADLHRLCSRGAGDGAFRATAPLTHPRKTWRQPVGRAAPFEKVRQSSGSSKPRPERRFSAAG